MRRAPIRIRTFILGTVLVLLLVADAGRRRGLVDRTRPPAGRRPAAAEHRRRLPRPPIAPRCKSRPLSRGSRGCSAGSICSRSWSSPGRPRSASSTSARPSAPKLRRAGSPPGEGPPSRHARRERVGRDRTRPGPMTAGGSSRPARRNRRPPWPSTSTTDRPPVPPGRSSRSSAESSSCSPGSQSRSGSPAAGWSRRSRRLSAQVDKVAGGDLTIAVPRSRIGEIANIAQAVEGMTAALGETAQRRAEADEARRFLVTSVAHDLRTPLFALRGHLQAIGSRLGNPAVHLERAEARADALERLVGNLFAYTRDDYAQPAPQLEAVTGRRPAPGGRPPASSTRPASEATRSTLDGDQALGVIVDRDRFKRALTNILDNALRFSPPGAPVQLSWAAADQSTVQITVQDHGPGIDPDLLPHIFEPGIRGAPPDGSPRRRRRARPHDRETPPRTPTRHPHRPQPTDRWRSHHPHAATSTVRRRPLAARR